MNGLPFRTGPCVTFGGSIRVATLCGQKIASLVINPHTVKFCRAGLKQGASHVGVGGRTQSDCSTAVVVFRTLGKRAGAGLRGHAQSTRKFKRTLSKLPYGGRMETDPGDS